MIDGYAARSRRGVPFVALGEPRPTLLVIPGIEPEYQEPSGLRLQGVHAAFDDVAGQVPLAVAWRAGPVDAWSPESIADDYVDLVEELGMPAVDIAGIATGAPFAIVAAARLAERCASLTLIGGGPRLSDAGREVLTTVAGLAEEGRWRDVARLQVRALYPGMTGAMLGAIAWLVPTIYGAPADSGFFAGLARLVARADVTEAARALTARVFVMCGERDLFYPPELIERTMSESSSGSSVRSVDTHVVPRAGHGLFKSHADEVWSATIAFVRG